MYRPWERLDGWVIDAGPCLRRKCAILLTTDISKAFDDRTSSRHLNVRAVDHLSIEVPDGRLYSLLGPSGCGKSTTLRMIAGLETPDEGRVAVNGRTFFDSARHINVVPHRRGLGMVFQSYSIWPHMSVSGNVAFALKGVRRCTRSEVRERVDRVLDLVQLTHLRERQATKLSGGQQQRLALARALVVEPPLLLLDEPLSNLDLKLRETLRRELKRMQRDLNITTLYVTHDQTEALALSDVIAVMNEGKIEQMGSPREIYNVPNNRFVADFVGAINFLTGVVERPESADRYVVRLSFGSATVDCVSALSRGAKATICIRPENVELLPDDGTTLSRPNVFRGMVSGSEFIGEAVEHRVQVANETVRARCKPTIPFKAGDSVQVHIPRERCAVVAD